MTDETNPRILDNLNQAFTAHGKKTDDPKVKRKIKNTAAFLDFADCIYVNSNKKIPRPILKRLLAKRKK